MRLAIKLHRMVTYSTLLSRSTSLARICPLSKSYSSLSEKKRWKHLTPTYQPPPSYCYTALRGADDDDSGEQPERRNCGSLQPHHQDQKVTLRGHLQYQRLGKFATLRDGHGNTQVIVDDQDIQLQKVLRETSYESYVEVKGTVQLRPPGQQNKDMATGEIEVMVEEYRVINPACKDLPFHIRDFNQPREQLRLKYRYLDLRHKQLQNNLRLKSQVGKKMRDFLQDKEGFIELTTPTLSVNTPGGAQEFVVPSRHIGKFYSLVQSPQTYKQLAMVGGFDRYFQFAVCYRDEGAKPDRQPEFMQVDLEMTNVSTSDVQQLTEQLLVHSWPSHLPDHPKAPFPTMTHDQALRTYGTDKPDIRFGWELRYVSVVLKRCGAKVFEDGVTEPGQSARAFVIPQAQEHISRKVVISWENLAQREHKLPGVSVFYVEDDAELKGGVSKRMTLESQKDLCRVLGANKGDVIVLAVGPHDRTCELLGRLRVASADILEAGGVSVRSKSFNFLWVVDFPLFEEDPDSEFLLSTHHPFTRPKEEDAHYLYTNPIKARSDHYDLVLNGCEIGGGSIRVHESDVQQHILHNILGVDPGSLGFLNEALQCGAPPHGGIALGYDRLIAEMCGADSIRDVIAFPKSMEGRCLMSGAPGDIMDEEKRLYNIAVVGKKSPRSKQKRWTSPNDGQTYTHKP